MVQQTPRLQQTLAGPEIGASRPHMPSGAERSPRPHLIVRAFHDFLDHPPFSAVRQGCAREASNALTGANRSNQSAARPCSSPQSERTVLLKITFPHRLTAQ